MRIAHFSDLHLLSLEGARVLDFANKRWIGGLNLITNRGRHYHTHVFEALVRDINEQGVEHCICTGDITNLALEQEFRYARERFDEIAIGPSEVTVLPGNHDAYVAKGSDYFTGYFSDYTEPDDGWRWDDGDWPLVRVRGSIAVIGLSTSLTTPWFTAYGIVGDRQLDRLRQVLADDRLADCHRIVAIHHPPAGSYARSRIRGLRDRHALAEVLADAGAELVIHGHEHRDLRHTLPGPGGGEIPVLGIQSGTYEAGKADRRARYRIFDTGGQTGRELELRQTTRVWEPDAGAFVADGELALAAA
jgi:3',5'-cyclic AMP phosphodiesterase CpdA